MSTARSDGFPACGGKGWLVMFNTDTRALELQRCDACCLFQSDEAAREHVARNPALQAEAQKALDAATARPEPAGKTGGPASTKTYLVGVREVHFRYYKVDAENEEQAKDLVHERGPEVEDIEFSEFSHELSRETWTVEEDQEGKPAS
jgi:hypothetical protein